MLWSADIAILLFASFYGILGLLLVTAGLLRIYRSRKKKKPKLTLIQGGKEERGPHG